MKIIDISTWKRAEHYRFFITADYPQYNICMNIDITNFLAITKTKKLSFYYAMTYAATDIANRVEEFRYRIRGEQVVLHERTHPSFTNITPGEELFKLVTVELEDSMEEFVQSAKKISGSQTSLFAPGDNDVRDDVVYITCIPWISFTSLSHTMKIQKEDSVPRISWGKYFAEGERILLPFSVQVNHALVDGIHVGKYVELLQQYLNEFE
ncbi:MAG: chloramphenicol acetyltransferase [Mobilitalea sp.]